MGVPLLYPWANRLSEEQFSVGGCAVDLRGAPAGVRRDPNGLPIHGLLAAHPGWEIVGATGPTSVTARFDLGAHPELLASFRSRTSSSTRSRWSRRACGSRSP